MNGREFDLVVLVPDKNMEAGVHGLLARPESLGIRQIRYQIYVHVERDPGCLRRGHDFLRPMVARFAHALVLFDRMGSGQERESRESLEETVQTRLSTAGWDDRAAALALDPELEVWVWNDSPHVSRILGWEHRTPDLRNWLWNLGEWPRQANKPSDPKRAVQLALRQVRKPRSSALYRQLGEAVSLHRCADPSFRRFQLIMRRWFAKES